MTAGPGLSAINTAPVRRLDAARGIFWDFDGVIKESLEVKAAAFERLFLPFGAETAGRVRRHHERQGGMSRFQKIPLYLEWAGLQPTPELIAEYSTRFGEAVMQAVIDAPWVPGVEAYLRRPRGHRIFVLVTATPQAEIETIVRALTLDRCFDEIWGAPAPKTDALARVLQARDLQPGTCVMVGDSGADCDAAQVNAVPFMLRQTPYNAELQSTHDGLSFRDLA